LNSCPLDPGKGSLDLSAVDRASQLTLLTISSQFLDNEGAAQRANLPAQVGIGRNVEKLLRGSTDRQ
jgi:hypothetical protein